MTTLLERFNDDPLVYAQKLNPAEDTVLLVEMTDDALHNHSFLDDRIFHPDMPFEWVPWREFEVQADLLPQKAPSYIFHIGHCGSTLLSRLVAEATGARALREPLPLRVFALNLVENVVDWLDTDETRKRLRLFEKTWARGADAVTVKATSVCTNLIGEVDAGSQVVFIHQGAETHLAVILAGENAPQELAAFGSNRYARLKSIADDLPPLEQMSVGELAAMAWLAEVSAAARAFEGRTAFKVDFDMFLANPAQLLGQVCGALGLESTPETVSQAVSGRTMRTYSKAPEHAYGPKLRDDIIADSKRRNADEIARGMRLVDRLRPTTCGEDWR